MYLFCQSRDFACLVGVLLVFFSCSSVFIISQNSLSLLNFVWDFSFGSQVPFEVVFFHLMAVAWCYILGSSLFASVQQNSHEYGTALLNKMGKLFCKEILKKKLKGKMDFFYLITT